MSNRRAVRRTLQAGSAALALLLLPSSAPAASVAAGRTAIAARRVAPLAAPDPASGTAGPQLTVVGFALLTETWPAEPAPPASAAVLVNINVQATGSRATAALAELRHDLGQVEAALRAAGVPASAMVPEEPQNLGYAAGQLQYSAGADVQVEMPSLGAAATMLDRLRPQRLADIGNVWVQVPGSGSVPGIATAAALAHAFTAALADARRTARTLAAADGLALGPQVQVREGAPGLPPDPCGAGSCGTGGAGLAPPPAPGPSQAVLAVTVTYATSRLPAGKG